MRSGIDELALKAFSIATQRGTDNTLINLLTNKEKVVLGRRLLIAEAIRSGKTRMEINERIKISPNTFAQINRWLISEQKIYTSATTKMKTSRKHIARRHKVEAFSYEDMKRRYPGHFLLFELVEELWNRP